MDLVSLLEQINIAPDIKKMFSFQPKSNLPSHSRTAVLLHYVFPGLWQPSARGGRDHLDSPYNIMLDHYIDDIMLI